DDREMVNIAYTESLKSRKPYNIEHRLLMSDGRVKYVNEICETYYGGDGKPMRSVGTVHDITERKLDEEALRRLNRELRAISNCNQTLMRAEDEQALLVTICHIVCDDAGYRMAWVGYPEDDEAKTIRPVAWAGVEEGYIGQAKLTWADTERGRGPSGMAIRSGESVSIQDFTTDPQATPWRDAALRRGYRSSISLPLKDENAKIFGIFNIYSAMPNAFTPDEVRLLDELAGDMAFGIRVLRARIERQRAEENLRQMNERFSLATRAARLGVWDWNLLKNELVWDDRMYELYGVRREDFSGAYEAWLKGLHPGDRAYSAEISMKAQRGEREYDTEFRVVWPDGSIHYLKAYGQFVRDADGRPVRMTGVNYDITELKEAEDKVIELNHYLEARVAERTAQLEAANKELEAFSYSVSHDLRTPLRAIDGFSKILLDDYRDKLDDEGKRLLNVVRDNTSRMAQLIDDILKFSRSGRTEMTLAEIDMERLAREVLAELQPSIDSSKLQVEIEHLPVARGDTAMMRQVFVNLLSNAIKFSRNREPARIKVGGSIEGGEAVYYVKDNGAGFDMQFADKLFGVFQRLHTTNEFEGTGIGLAIVKRIVTRHGGRAWAEGKLNEGATIYFSIPVGELPQREAL
ncbi:MAG TPA: PAS domain-containing protein, partial [Sideroxyarcus sp.]|nr:PAS domain-containing protein [Sideroxyarcus sp.]